MQPEAPLDPPAERAGDALETLLGASSRWTRDEVAARAGTTLAEATDWWGALGFAQAGPDERVFTDRDVAALRTVLSLHRNAGIERAESLLLARVMGRSMARLAEGELDAVLSTLELDRVLELGANLLTDLEALLVYVWRRHLSAATSRLLANPDLASAPRVVGFVDLVGYTTRSRGLSEVELTGLVAQFDAAVSDAVVAAGGQVVKTIGDEVMWVHDDAVRAADCALSLAERLLDPPVRTGLAFGRTATRGGDHFGPVVNLASRLTGLARPGSVLADRELAAHLAGEPQRFSLRPLRPVTVRGYAHLSATVIRRGRGAPTGRRGE